MSVTQSGLQRSRMSWEAFLALPDDVRAEWVDGEVVVSPPVSFDHGEAAVSLATVLKQALPRLIVVQEVGLLLPRDRLRAPDVMVVEGRPSGRWVTAPPVLVAEVLSPSTRTEDTVRKAAEYAEGGVGQLWLMDPEARALDVFTNAVGSWERLLRLDDAVTSGQVAVGAAGEHGVVALDLGDLLPPLPPLPPPSP